MQPLGTRIMLSRVAFSWVLQELTQVPFELEISKVSLWLSKIRPLRFERVASWEG